MDDTSTLRQRLKELMVEQLNLPLGADEIGDEAPLFDPEGLALDSVDALQLATVLDKQYGLKLADPEAAREVLQSVATMAAAVQRQQAAGG